MSETVQNAPILSSNIMVQVAIVVNDIETTLENWCNLFGVKNYGYTLTKPKEITGITFRGESTDALAKIGFVKLGQVTLEIIEPDHNPSVWREHLDAHGEGFHHIAFKADDLDTTLAHFTAKDMPLVQRGSYVTGEYAYMDTTDSLKMMIELLHQFK